jgi:hypothetical protein
VGYAGQTAAVTMSLYEKLAALRAGKGLVRGQFKMDRAGAKALGISEMASAVNSSLERGIVGSSVDYAGRTGALAAKETAMQQAMQQRTMGLLGLRTQRIGAMNEYYNGLFSIQAQKSAERSEMATQAYLNDLVMMLQNPAAGRPGGGGNRGGRPGNGRPGQGQGQGPLNGSGEVDADKRRAMELIKLLMQQGRLV